MLTLVSRLRRSYRPGTTDEVRTGFIEWPGDSARAYADADGAVAAAHGNAIEDSTHPFGDHPFGLYRVVAVVWSTTDQERAIYGPVRLRLDPVAGDALVAKQNGRTGLCIHGGPTRDGALRATNGCLRVDDATAVALARLAEPELHAGNLVSYDCRDLGWVQAA